MTTQCICFSRLCAIVNIKTMLVSVKLVLSFYITNEHIIVTSKHVINSTLTTICEFDTCEIDTLIQCTSTLFLQITVLYVILFDHYDVDLN